MEYDQWVIELASTACASNRCYNKKKNTSDGGNSLWQIFMMNTANQLELEDYDESETVFKYLKKPRLIV